MVRETKFGGDELSDSTDAREPSAPSYVDSFGGGQDDDALLRPTRMFDMVGQREVYARIEIAVKAAQKRGETLGHILFDGPPAEGYCAVFNERAGGLRSLYR